MVSVWHVDSISSHSVGLSIVEDVLNVLRVVEDESMVRVSSTLLSNSSFTLLVGSGGSNKVTIDVDVNSEGSVVVVGVTSPSRSRGGAGSIQESLWSRVGNHNGQW